MPILTSREKDSYDNLAELITVTKPINLDDLFLQSSNSLRVIKTTDRLVISNDRAELPSKALGDIVWNMGLIFDNDIDLIITNEVTCKVSEDGLYVEFDPDDLLNDKYCIVSYLEAGE